MVRLAPVRATLSAPAVALLLAVVGCSTSSEGTPAAIAGTDAGAQRDPVGVPSTDGGLERDAAASGSEAQDPRMWPMEVGRTWTYAVEGGLYGCAGKSETTFQVVSATTIDGTAAFKVVDECGYDDAVYRVEGVIERQYSWTNGEWTRVLDSVLEDGHEWTTSNGSSIAMRLEEVGQVVTPAGTFDDCWRTVQEVSYLQSWTFCRGVGMVEMRLYEERLSLVAKSY